MQTDLEKEKKSKNTGQVKDFVMSHYTNKFKMYNFL